MPDWDQDSPRLRANLQKLLEEIRDKSRARKPLKLTDAKLWHRRMMRGLTPPDPAMVGRFRGSLGMTEVEVFVGSFPGVPALEVHSQASQFEKTLGKLIGYLDRSIPVGGASTPDQLAAVIEACAWAHAEWVRIHPFANGNGRTARLWANAIAMRYHLPPFVRLRPRPNWGYEAAAAEAMRGNYQMTIPTFRRMLAAFLKEITP
jgi:Fic family protein